MDEQQQKIFDDLMWKGEMSMRDRGLTDAQISAKKQEAWRIFEQTPLTDAQWDQLARIDGGEPPSDVLMNFGKDDWIVRLAAHRALLAAALLAVAALLGYLDAGVAGALAGLAIGAFALGYAVLSVRRRRR